MAVDPNTLKALRSPTSSWAVWSDEFPAAGSLCEQPSDIEAFMMSRAASLRPDVIFVGYNPTRGPRQLTHPFQSFHLPSSLCPHGRDGRLKRLVQDDLTDRLRAEGAPNRLAGAFMTDIFPDSPGSSVKDTEVRHRGEQYASFRDKICTLLADPNFPEPRVLTLIAFGRAAWTSLQEALSISDAIAVVSGFQFKGVCGCKPFASAQVQDDVICPSGPVTVWLLPFGIWHYSSRRSNRCIRRQLECIISEVRDFEFR